MKIIKPSAEYFGPLPVGYEDTLRFIERAGRTCYKSEGKITPDSAEKFVRRLIKSEHLAMVEHSNFVIRSNASSLNTAELTGKYLNDYCSGTFDYIGGSLTAWYNRYKEIGDSSIFIPFNIVYGELFNIKSSPVNFHWKICSHNEIPKELHRYSVKITCDRGVSHELVRHRPCSFAQESTRYVNYAGKEMEFIEPAGYYEDWNEDTKYYFEDICERTEDTYTGLVYDEKSPQQARAVLPNALKTEIVVTADLKEWQHIFKLRCHKTAHPDMVRVMTMVRDEFVKNGVIGGQ